MGVGGLRALTTETMKALLVSFLSVLAAKVIEVSASASRKA